MFSHGKWDLPAALMKETLGGKTQRFDGEPLCLSSGLQNLLQNIFKTNSNIKKSCQPLMQEFNFWLTFQDANEFNPEPSPEKIASVDWPARLTRPMKWCKLQQLALTCCLLCCCRLVVALCCALSNCLRTACLWTGVKPGRKGVPLSMLSHQPHAH